MLWINGRFLTLPLTGVQRYAFEVVRRFYGEFKIVAPTKMRREYAKIGHSVQIHSWILNAVIGSGHLWEQYVLPKLLNSHDLLFSPSNTGPLKIQRQVVTIHDIVPLVHPEWMNPGFAAWYRFLVPRLVQKVQRIITVSEYTRSQLLSYSNVDERKVIVIPNGVESRFYPNACNRKALEHLRSKYNLPTVNYLLCLGSIEPRKNLRRLFIAWRRIKNLIPNDIWLVVAGGKGRKAIFRNVALNDIPPRTFFIGYVSDQDLPALYGGAIAFIYPSLYEGFGLPPLEAMACGTPVVTSNVTALPEVVGDAAVLVDPYDVDSIAEGIRRVVEDSALRETLRLKGLERARQFSWDRTAELTWKVLQEAAENG